MHCGEEETVLGNVHLLGEGHDYGVVRDQWQDRVYTHVIKVLTDIIHWLTSDEWQIYALISETKLTLE